MRSYQGAVLVVTHDRFFCRCVVEGQNPAKLRKRPGIDDDDDVEDDPSEDDDEDGPQKKGIVYRMFKGQLRLLDDGMDQYEAICERAAARMSKAQKT
jgi:ATP-binding cassette subfamily F protein 3